MSDLIERLREHADRLDRVTDNTLLARNGPPRVIVDLREAATALEAAQRENEWKPIETAPDNEWVLCFGENWQYPVALMRCQVYLSSTDPVMKWVDDSHDSCQNWNPTHWRRWPELVAWHRASRPNEH